MAQTVLLALDADTAGQEAMLKASGLAAKRKLELRVVPLPAGSDPADLIQQRGRRGDEGARRRVGGVRAVPRRARARERRRLEPRGPRPDHRAAAPRVRDAPAERDADGAHAESCPGAWRCRRASPRRCSRAGARPPRRSRHIRRRAAGTCRGGRTPSGRSSRCASPRQRRARWRWRTWTWRSTSPAACCDAPRDGCARGASRSRCATGPARARRWTTIRS